MTPRKCFFGCEGEEKKLNLFAFPKDESTRQKWIQFLFSGKKQPYAYVFVCSRHFTEDCFLNRAQYEAGFSARLVLKDGSVPSIKGRVEESEAQASTSQQTSTTHSTPQYRHKGCQTDPEPTVSVSTQFCPLMLSVGTQMYYSPSTKSAATQLSYGTLKQHVRSKATQVREPRMRNCGVGTLTFPLDSPLLFLQPTIVDRPAKRPRLSLTDEEEGPSECSLSVLVQEPKDST
ncbi:uncharacterized protein LOC122987624 [Thunnus albacares]|uniref:uncharacterized protein LOC122987624 n=1 Tax=Thunnus albacares TaxID=8236 RepID=UPI001CF6563D|nr:uncharacterized protein LOC122987624 [Thunnus albacares]